MNIGEFARDQFVRLLAIVCLFIGLADAARLLGVSTGAINPITMLGTTGFVLLAAFTLARLFAAVGMWINASWGAVLLIGATSVELLLVLFGSDDVGLSGSGVFIRFLLLVAISSSLGLRYWKLRDHVHD